MTFESKVEFLSRHIGEFLQYNVKRRTDDILEVSVRVGDICDFALFLRDAPECRFKILTDLFAVDYPERAERFEVIYMFLSIAHNVRVCCKVALKEGSSVPSVTKIFSTAAWFEREVFDMYGIVFENHQDLRRILTDYGFRGHPMLKDFPLTGYKEVKYDPQKKKVTYQPVDLPQGFRSFDFLSPWKGDA